MVSVTPGLEMLPCAAVIVVDPANNPVANPPLLIVANPVLLEVQVDAVVQSYGDPLTGVQVATYCCAPPMLIVAAVGVTAMLDRPPVTTIEMLLDVLPLYEVSPL